jgi:hypothetical protein
MFRRKRGHFGVNFDQKGLITSNLERRALLPLLNSCGFFTERQNWIVHIFEQVSDERGLMGRTTTNAPPVSACTISLFTRSLLPTTLCSLKPATQRCPEIIPMYSLMDLHE